MYSLSDLQQEIGAKIEYLKDHNGPVLHPDWIAQAIFADHDKIEGKDADFYKACAWTTVRREVRQQINQTESKPNTRQLTLEGFEHLQHYYVVTRDKEQVAVRVDELTDTEIEAKAGEYDSMGRACLSHADELRRYKELRRNTQFAATFKRVATGHRPAL